MAWDTQFALENHSLVNGKLTVSNRDSDDDVTISLSDVLGGVNISNATGESNITLEGAVLGVSGGRTAASKISTGANGAGFPDDTVSLLVNEVLTGPLTMSFGPQAASLIVHDLDVTGNLSITTGYNDDLVDLNNVSPTKVFTVRTGLGDDTVNLTKGSEPLGPLMIDTGAGNDSVSLDGRTDGYVAEYFGPVKVNLGTGDDSLWVSDGGVNGNIGHYHATVKFDGGTGTDDIAYLTTGSIFDVAPVVVNFESAT